MSCIAASQPDTSCSVPPHRRTATADHVLGSHSTTSVAVAQRSDTTSGVEDAVGDADAAKGLPIAKHNLYEAHLFELSEENVNLLPTDSFASSPNTHIEKEASTINLLRMAP